MADRPSSRRGADGFGGAGDGASGPAAGGGGGGGGGVLRANAALKPMQGMGTIGGFGVGAAPVTGLGPAHFASPALGTALRPPTGQQQRMGTAQRLSTAQRQQQQQQRPGSRGGVGLNTNLQVADRPVTQQGMMGMKTGAQGPGRQVADKTFYQGELRKKIEEMNTEIQKMNEEMEQYNYDNAQYSQLERRDEALIKDVRELQATLADYNLVVDKARDHVDPETILTQFQGLRSRNDVEKKKVDDIFKRRQRNEAEIKEVESQIGKLVSAAEAKLNELSVEKRSRYQMLQQEMGRLQIETAKKQEVYDRLCRQLDKYEQMLKKEPLKNRLHILQEQRHQLEQRKRELEVETSKEQLSVPQLREKLLAQVKEDNRQIVIADRQVKETDEAVQSLSKQLSALEDGTASAQLNEQQAKYEQLLAKDKEMTEFIDGFENNFKAEVAAVEQCELKIVKLLEETSKDLMRQHNLPSADRAQEMSKELDQKKMSFVHTQTTAERLQQECEVRRSELEKIKNLDAKIIQELAATNEKITQMKADLIVFSNIDELKAKSEARRKAMLTQKQDLFGHKEALKQQTQIAVSNFEAKKQKLAQSDVYTSLEGLEQKLSYYEQNIFHLNDYVLAKRKETNYGPILQDVSNLVAEMNALLVGSLTHQTFSMTAM